GTFSLLQDGGIGAGQALVADPRIQAVGFTGSRRAGEALVAIAQARPQPIPVYAEMSAINPVVLLPAALEERAEQIAAGFITSLTMGAGQFCTNPGLVLAIAGPALDRFCAAAVNALAGCDPAIMLTPGILGAYQAAANSMAAHRAVSTVASAAAAPGRAEARLNSVSADAFLADPALHAEVFGPASLVVVCRDAAQLAQVLGAVEGQLTIALHFAQADHALAGQLLPIARRKAGRVLANGFGTGVEVSPAMVHGGPWPATSDTRSTSVGTKAIERFLRPVCLQDFPQDLLPPAVQDANPWGLPRRLW
ncbi:MAG TPA: aldehyde dehydrogenase family protein, partial [Novosphingobium sp.]|nr:aldehyde dehydrogenase family protein [Novosphingobium sp.]